MVLKYFDSINEPKTSQEPSSLFGLEGTGNIFLKAIHDINFEVWVEWPGFCEDFLKDAQWMGALKQKEFMEEMIRVLTLFILLLQLAEILRMNWEGFRGGARTPSHLVIFSLIF